MDSNASKAPTFKLNSTKFLSLYCISVRIFEKTNSTGLKSGEYVGVYTSSTPMSFKKTFQVFVRLRNDELGNYLRQRYRLIPVLGVQFEHPQRLLLAQKNARSQE